MDYAFLKESTYIKISCRVCAYGNMNESLLKLDEVMNDKGEVGIVAMKTKYLVIN